MTEPRRLRVGFDLSKAHHPDGIGTWQRETARALSRRPRDDLRFVGLGAAPGPEAAADEGVFEASAGSVEAPPPGLDVLVSSAWTVPRRFDGVLLYVVHDLTFVTHPECHLRANRLHCLEGLIRADLVMRRHFVAVSRSTAEILASLLQRPVPAAGPLDITVIANGVDAFWSRSEGAGDELPAGLGAESFVLSVGSLEPRKNLERLWRAYGALPDTLRGRFPLVLVGGHGWKNESLLAQLHGADGVHVLGKVSRPVLRALYNNTALFVYPSLAEGFGLPVAEAMACGAPVLTSDVTSLPEVAGDAAVLVDPTDVEALTRSMHDLLVSPERRRDLAGRGPAQAARFDWSETARRLGDLILAVARDPVARDPVARDPVSRDPVGA